MGSIIKIGHKISSASLKLQKRDESSPTFNDEIISQFKALTLSDPLQAKCLIHEATRLQKRINRAELTASKFAEYKKALVDVKFDPITAENLLYSLALAASHQKFHAFSHETKVNWFNFSNTTETMKQIIKILEDKAKHPAAQSVFVPLNSDTQQSIRSYFMGLLPGLSELGFTSALAPEPVPKAINEEPQEAEQDGEKINANNDANKENNDVNKEEVNHEIKINGETFAGFKENAANLRNKISNLIKACFVLDGKINFNKAMQAWERFARNTSSHSNLFKCPMTHLFCEPENRAYYFHECEPSKVQEVQAAIRKFNDYVSPWKDYIDGKNDEADKKSQARNREVDERAEANKSIARKVYVRKATPDDIKADTAMLQFYNN